MKMQLVPSNHPLLSTKLELFDFHQKYEHTPEQIANLLEFKMNEENGIGLSANQLGLPYRVFVMKTEPARVCFNPIVTFQLDEKIFMEEGCLTYPLLFVKIGRSGLIRVRYQNVNGETIVEKFSGISARVFLHELDHLNGIDFTQRASRIALNRAKKKQKLLSRRMKHKNLF